MTICLNSLSWDRAWQNVAAVARRMGQTIWGRRMPEFNWRRDQKVALPFASPGDSVYVEEQRAMIQLLGRLNRLAQREFPRDEKLEARIKSYELAFRMQTAVPRLLELQQETRETQTLYGLNTPATAGFARRCLAARRLVEQGVRFVQVFHGGNGGAGRWDSHKNLRAQHRNMCRQVDRPIGALLKDLKRRGLLDDTLVVWATEFGRSPGAQNAKGRDHHPYGFSIWLAGGGIKGGTVHGATDELGFHAVQDRHYVTDLHATVLKQLGAGLAPAFSPRAQAAGHRLWQAD